MDTLINEEDQAYKKKKPPTKKKRTKVSLQEVEPWPEQEDLVMSQHEEDIPETKPKKRKKNLSSVTINMLTDFRWNSNGQNQEDKPSEKEQA